MGLVYLVCGILILNEQQNIFALPYTFKILFGVLMIIYGSFRVYRYWQAGKNNNEKT